jgi:hypothetical protein
LVKGNLRCGDELGAELARVWSFARFGPKPNVERPSGDAQRIGGGPTSFGHASLIRH